MATAPDNRPWPTEVRLAKDKKALTVTFDTGESFALDAEYLRVMSPSAEVHGHLRPTSARPSPAKNIWTSSRARDWAAPAPRRSPPKACMSR